MKRRNLLIGGAAAATASAAVAAIQPQSERLTFLLAHGTWHGGWAWRDVRNRLEDMGHRVFTPTLTGCGEREHLSSPDVGLETHTQDLVNVIRFEELHEVILVGHSFTGVAITGVADRMKDRIRHIVFFDALVPTETRRSGAPRDENGELAEYFRKRQPKFIDGYKMDFWEDYSIKMLMPEDSPHAERVRRLLTTHPAKSWTDELELKNGGWEGLPRTYIHCVGQAFAKSSEKMVGPARGPEWNFVELDIPRDGMITDPDIVTEALLAVA